MHLAVILSRALAPLQSRAGNLQRPLSLAAAPVESRALQQIRNRSPERADIHFRPDPPLGFLTSLAYCDNRTLSRLFHREPLLGLPLRSVFPAAGRGPFRNRSPCIPLLPPRRNRRSGCRRADTRFPGISLTTGTARPTGGLGRPRRAPSMGLHLRGFLPAGDDRVFARPPLASFPPPETEVPGRPAPQSLARPRIGILPPKRELRPP
jgi:hypothetical protein